MRKLIVFAVLGFGVLTGCGTPQERCINRETREIRHLQDMLDEVEGNLARGYAFETITVYEDYWTYCPMPAPVEGQPAPKPRMCLDERPVTEQRPKAIDLNEEARKLASLKEKRKSLALQAEKVIAACKAQYPE